MYINVHNTFAYRWIYVRVNEKINNAFIVQREAIYTMDSLICHDSPQIWKDV